MCTPYTISYNHSLMSLFIVPWLLHPQVNVMPIWKLLVWVHYSVKSSAYATRSTHYICPEHVKSSAHATQSIHYTGPQQCQTLSICHPKYSLHLPWAMSNPQHMPSKVLTMLALSNVKSSAYAIQSTGAFRPEAQSNSGSWASVWQFSSEQKPMGQYLAQTLLWRTGEKLPSKSPWASI